MKTSKSNLNHLLLEDIQTLVKTNGYVLLSSGVTDIWIVELLAQQFGIPRGGTFWEKYFYVEFAPGARNQTAEQSLAYSSTDFPIHTDGSFEDKPPNIFILQCIQNDRKGYGTSILVDGWAAASMLEESTLRILLETPFEFKRTRKSKSSTTHAPILKRKENTFEIRYRRDHNFQLIPPSDSAQIALQKWEENLRTPELQVNLDLVPGDILIVNNQRILHGRTPLSGKQHRILRRLWLD